MPFASSPALALEICVDTSAGLMTAEREGADRVELCSALDLGGLTPGPGLIAQAAKASIPAHAMVRPRAGDFVFDTADIDACLADIDAMKTAGLAGIVIGASEPGGRLDSRTLARLVDAAGGLTVTLHRAFDLVPDWEEALEIAIDLSIHRILTSGGAPRVGEGIELIGAMVQKAGGRIEIMAGGGLRPADVRPLIAAGVDALHASAGSPRPTRQNLAAIGLADTRKETDAALIAALVSEWKEVA